MIKLVSVLSVLHQKLSAHRKNCSFHCRKSSIKPLLSKKSPSNKADCLGVSWMHVEISFVLSLGQLHWARNLRVARFACWIMFPRLGLCHSYSSVQVKVTKSSKRGVTSPQTCRPQAKSFGLVSLPLAIKLLIRVGLVCCLSFVLSSAKFAGNFKSDERTGTTFPSILEKSGRNLAQLRPASYCFTYWYELTMASKKTKYTGENNISFRLLCVLAVQIKLAYQITIYEGEILYILVRGSAIGPVPFGYRPVRLWDIVNITTN